MYFLTVPVSQHIVLLFSLPTTTTSRLTKRLLILSQLGSLPTVSDAHSYLLHTHSSHEAHVEVAPGGGDHGLGRLQPADEVLEDWDWVPQIG